MIDVTLLKDKSEKLKGFELQGHANYSERGTDIVCAAVSILSTTAVNTLYKYNIKFDFKDTNDLMRLYTDDNSKTTQIILNDFLIGIESILDVHSDYIKLHSREV